LLKAALVIFAQRSHDLIQAVGLKTPALYQHSNVCKWVVIGIKRQSSFYCTQKRCYLSKRKSRLQILLHPHSGTDVTIFKIFSPKNRQKWHFLIKTKLNLAKF
jgi:hypothetical protein